jgi:hypothetical protein
MVKGVIGGEEAASGEEMAKRKWHRHENNGAVSGGISGVAASPKQAAAKNNETEMAAANEAYQWRHRMEAKPPVMKMAAENNGDNIERRQ